MMRKCAFAWLLAALAGGAPGFGVMPVARPRADFRLGALSGPRLAFERVGERFVARGVGYRLAVSSAGLVITNFEGFGGVDNWDKEETTRIRLLGGVERAFESGEMSAPGSLRLRDAYPGIDLVCAGKPERLELRLLAREGADVSAIGFEFEGIYSVRIAPDGAAVIRTALGELRIRRPETADPLGGESAPVAGAYVRERRNRVKFAPDGK
jgi:hypothetical protein